MLNDNCLFWTIEADNNFRINLFRHANKYFFFNDCNGWKDQVDFWFVEQRLKYFLRIKNHKHLLKVFLIFHFLPLKLPHFFCGFLPTFLQYPQQSELDPQGDPGPLQGSIPLVIINMIKNSDNSLKICLVKFIFWILRAIISVNGLFYTVWRFWGSSGLINHS